MINELFQQEGQSIFSFKKGDIIIRLKSAEIKEQDYNETLGITIEKVTKIDDSCRRYPVEFIGIYNNLIYLKDLYNSKLMDRTVPIKLLIEHFSDDWALFVIPDGLSLNECI